MRNESSVVAVPGPPGGHGVDQVVVRQRHQGVVDQKDREDRPQARKRDVNKALPGRGPVDLGRIVQIALDHGQAGHDQDRRERELGPDEGDHHGEPGKARIGQPGNVAIDQSDLVEQEIEEAPRRVKHPDPNHRRDRARQDPGQDHRGAHQRAAAKGRKQQAGREEAREDRERGGDRGKRHGVAQGLPEGRAGHHLPVVVEADERLLREDRDHLVEAAIECVGGRVEREQEDEAERRQHPGDGVTLVAHHRPGPRPGALRSVPTALSCRARAS